MITRQSGATFGLALGLLVLAVAHYGLDPVAACKRACGCEADDPNQVDANKDEPPRGYHLIMIAEQLLFFRSAEALSCSGPFSDNISRLKTDSSVLCLVGREAPSSFFGGAIAGGFFVYAIAPFAHVVYVMSAVTTAGASRAFAGRAVYDGIETIFNVLKLGLTLPLAAAESSGRAAAEAFVVVAAARLAFSATALFTEGSRDFFKEYDAGPDVLKRPASLSCALPFDWLLRYAARPTAFRALVSLLDFFVALIAAILASDSRHANNGALDVAFLLFCTPIFVVVAGLFILDVFARALLCCAGRRARVAVKP